MKYVYVVSYDDTTNNPTIHIQIKQINHYFKNVGIEKIVCGYDEFSIYFLEDAIHTLNPEIFIHSQFHTNTLTSSNQAITSTFEQEILLSISSVVFIMHKQNAKHLFSYINPNFTELERLSANPISLFRIVCEHDRIGIERLWRPFVKTHN